MYATLPEDTTNTVDTVTRPTQRTHCAGCGEYWPCSDSGRRDISGLVRAQHGPGKTGAPPAQTPVEPLWETITAPMDLLPETLDEIVAAGIRDRELLSAERGYDFVSCGERVTGTLSGEVYRTPQAIAHCYDVVMACELSTYAIADLRAKDPRNMGLLVYEAALLQR